jgi:hypothetical protein
MFRRHLPTIITLTLLCVVGAAFGLFLTIGGIPSALPLWAVIGLCFVVGTVISIVANLITPLLVGWFDERQSVKAYEKENGR